MNYSSGHITVIGDLPLEHHHKSAVVWSNGDIKYGEPEYIVAYYKRKPFCFAHTSQLGAYIKVEFAFLELRHITSIVEALCEYIFLRYPDIMKLCIFITSKDWFGKKLMHKTGFIAEVCMRKHVKASGKVCDLLVFSKFSPRHK